MSLPEIAAAGLAEVLDAPLVNLLCAPELLKPIAEHFTLGADELGRALQDSGARALYGIGLGLSPSALDPRQVLASKIAKEFGRQVETAYLLPFAKQQRITDKDLEGFRRRALRLCRAAADDIETLLPRQAIPEPELAALFQESARPRLSALLLERIQATPTLSVHLDVDLTTFLGYRELLGEALLYFLRETLRKDKRVQTTLQALQQAGVWADVQDIQTAQTTLTAGLERQRTLLERQLGDHRSQMVDLIQQNRFADIGASQRQAQALQERLDGLAERYAGVPALLTELHQSQTQRATEFQTLYDLTQSGLEEIQSGLATIGETLDDIHADVRGIDVHILDLQFQIDRMGSRMDAGIQGIAQEIVGELFRLNARAPLAGAGLSCLIQDPNQRRKVKVLLARLDEQPPAALARIPAIYNDAGKLEQAIGDFPAAQDRYEQGSQRIDEPATAAKLRYNAYRVALEAKDWDKALEQLRAAIAGDPGQFTPFPPDEYILERILGAGGFGVAFLCREPSLERQVVIKTPYDDRDDQAFAEGRKQCRLTDDRIVRVYRAGYTQKQPKRRPYLVMEYFRDSHDLDAYLKKQGPLDLATTRDLARALAQALVVAHGKGILHRDIKPGNILVREQDGRLAVKLIDFGLAVQQRLDARTVLASGNKTLLAASQAGTLDFGAPEQLGKLPGVPVKEPADLYALGATLSYCLFRQTRPNRRHWRQLAEQDETFADALDQCLEEQPDERWQSAEEFLAALDAKTPADKAKSDPERLRDDLAWQRAKRRNDINAYRAYLDDASLPHYQAKEAETHIDELAWAKIERQDDIGAYKSYLKNAGTHSIHAQDAYQRVLELEAEIEIETKERQRQEQAEREAKERQRRERAEREAEERQRREQAERQKAERRRILTPQDIHSWDKNRVQTLQRSVAEAIGKPVNFRDRLKDGSDGPQMVVIPLGRFLMGSPDDEPERDDDEGQHPVTLTKPFALARHAVMVSEFRAFTQADGYQTEAEKGDGAYGMINDEWKMDKRFNWQTSGFEQQPDHPVTCLSWNDAIAYCKWLSRQTGADYRLPTEAEWEYACRAGTTTPFWWGDGITTDQANYNGNYPYNNGPKGEYRGKTVPVDQFDPNPWGLYQMHGNVLEWVQDWFSDYSGDAQVDPIYDGSGSDRVIRGGSWGYDAQLLRAAYRDWYEPGDRFDRLGFRPARTFSF